MLFANLQNAIENCELRNKDFCEKLHTILVITIKGCACLFFPWVVAN